MRFEWLLALSWLSWAHSFHNNNNNNDWRRGGGTSRFVVGPNCLQAPMPLPTHNNGPPPFRTTATAAVWRSLSAKNHDAHPATKEYRNGTTVIGDAHVAADYPNPKKSEESELDGHDNDNQVVVQFGTPEFWDLCLDLRANEAPILQSLSQRQKDYDDKKTDWNPRNPYDPDGFTLLHYACLQDATNVVRAVLEHKDHDKIHHNPIHVATFEYESTPLMKAAYRGCQDIVELLMEHGGDMYQRDVFGYTPLQHACFGGSSTVVSTLLGVSRHNNKQEEEAKDDNQLLDEILKILNMFSSSEKENQDVNVADEETGFTPLHIACSLGRMDLVEALLELGAFVDQPNTEGRTPLFFAAGCGHADILPLLVQEWGADVHAATTTAISMQHIATPGWTPLQEASAKNQWECVKTLLQLGADVNAQNVGKETSLLVAAQHGHAAVTKLLLQSGANVVQGDDWNNTPLHTACRQNHYNVVVALLLHSSSVGAEEADDHGWNMMDDVVNARNKYHETPLHQACWLGRETIALLLLEHGADVHAKNKDQQTPIDYARIRGHVALAKQLKAAYNYAAKSRG